MSDKEKTIDILVIGNGFDLANGLKTSYADFLDFCNEIEEKTNCEFSFKIKELIKDNFLYKYLYKLYKPYLEMGKNWIDFESEIAYIVDRIDKQCNDYNKHINIDDINITQDLLYSYLERISIFFNLYTIHAKADDYKVQEQYNEEHGKVMDYYYYPVDKLIDNLYKALSDMVKALELYLADILNPSNRARLRNKEFSDKYNISHIISFNYTKTTDEVLPDVSEENKYFVHGKLNPNEDDCNMIIGIDRDVINVDRTAIFKKDIQRMVFDTNKELTRFKRDFKKIAIKENDIINLIFFGHSMDKTDNSILKKLLNINKFIECKATINIIIYSNDMTSKQSQVMNVAQIIGEEELTNRSLEGLIDFRIIKSNGKYMVTN